MTPNKQADIQELEHDGNLWFILHKFLRSIASLPWLAEVVSLLGCIVFILQLWKYARLLPSVLDEGTYLYKGLLYVSGQYTMYQFYGPWSNKMPLSFLIPGSIQYLLEPGLLTGRGFAIALAVLMLLGSWVLGKRLGGRWWAAAVVWIFAINISAIKMFSLGVSQGLIACMLVWTLILVIGDDRPTWQIALGSILAGLMAITRLNLMPVLPVLILYVFWAHGRRKGLIAASLGILTIIIGYLIFWPGILQVWALLLPRSVTPFLNKWRTQTYFSSVWNPVITKENQILSLSQSIRNHFTALIALLIAVLLWPIKGGFKKKSDLRTAVFLCALFIILLLIHTWSSVGSYYCVFCLSSYLTFFSSIGILLIPLTYTAWRKQIPLRLQLVIILLIIFISTLVGFGVYEQIGKQILEIQIPRSILEFPDKVSGTVPIQNYLKKTYDYDFKTSRRVVSTILGFGISLLILFLAFVIRVIFPHLRKLFSKDNKSALPVYGYWALLLFLLIGSILSPVVDIMDERDAFFCNRDVIASYEAAGEHLASVIPPGAQVYWKGGNSVVPLLYVPEIKIYPPQLNGDYSYKYDGDPDQLLKYGWWSVPLADQWINEADFVLVQQRYYDEWYRKRLKSGAFEELESTNPTVYCEDNTHIRIFKRLP
ncbi:MAG: hypothetical protein WBD56_07770 [Anaerolineales bacterium]